jgi:hypothetical protein
MVLSKDSQGDQAPSVQIVHYINQAASEESTTYGLLHADADFGTSPKFLDGACNDRRVEHASRKLDKFNKAYYQGAKQ